MEPIHKVYTDHANVIRDALDMTSDRVYQWRLLLEEVGPRLSILKAYTTLLQTQSHGLSMTPVSIEQLRVTT
jgi:hypothetical protein